MTLALGAGTAAAATEVVASGLDNARGLGFAPDGTLYVAEAGHGGSGACLVNSGNETVCYGETGALTRINGDGSVTRVVSGLPSLASRTGFGATGPDDVSFLGGGNAQLAVGLAASAGARATIGPAGRLFGTVLQVSHGGQYRAVADIAAFEAAGNPDGGTYPPGGPLAGQPKTDSNPYGVLALPSRRIVADAGGNSLLEVLANGATRVLATFGPRIVPSPFGGTLPMEAVPTSVAVGPDGFLYVGQLTGFPFPQGAARVYRIPPEGGAPEIFASGFTNIIDVAFDDDGNLFVLQIGNGFAPGVPPIASPGSLWKVAPDGTRSQVETGRPLVFPGGVAVGPDGAIYVTNKSIFPAAAGGGEVLKISP